IVQSSCTLLWHCSLSVRPPGTQRKPGWDACARRRLLAGHRRWIHFWGRRLLCTERRKNGNDGEGYRGHVHQWAAYCVRDSQHLHASTGCSQWEEHSGPSTQRMVLHIRQVAREAAKRITAKNTEETRS